MSGKRLRVTKGTVPQDILCPSCHAAYGPRVARRKGLRRTSRRLQVGVSICRTSLRAATAAVEQVGKSVKIETDILWGPADTALADESQSAAMICVGSVGIGAIAHKLIGSTAAAVAERSHCPVAIIRTPHHKPEPGIDWIVVAIADEPDFDIVVEYAMKEAQLRQAPILAVGLSNEEFGHAPHHTLDRRLEAWKKRYPMCTFIRSARQIASPVSWARTMTNRCSWLSSAAEASTKSQESSGH